jgi:hypothetical protein
MKEEPATEIAVAPLPVWFETEAGNTETSKEPEQSEKKFV